MPPMSTPAFQDKSLWLVVLTFLGTILAKKTGIDIPPEALYSFGAILASYILASKGKQSEIAQAQIAAQGQPAPVAPPAPVEGPRTQLKLPDGGNGTPAVVVQPGKPTPPES